MLLKMEDVLLSEAYSGSRNTASIVQGDRCSTRRATGMGDCEVDASKHLVPLLVVCGVL